MVVSKQSKKESFLTERERVVLAEIGRDEIISASSFVDYVSEEYLMPKSTVWYTLNKLKSKGMLDFASRDEVGKPLQLTHRGLHELTAINAPNTYTRAPVPNPVMARTYAHASPVVSEYWYEDTHYHAKISYKQKFVYSLG